MGSGLSPRAHSTSAFLCVVLLAIFLCRGLVRISNTIAVACLKEMYTRGECTPAFTIVNDVLSLLSSTDDMQNTTAHDDPMLGALAFQTLARVCSCSNETNEWTPFANFAALKQSNTGTVLLWKYIGDSMAQWFVRQLKQQTRGGFQTCPNPRAGFI